MTMFRPFYRFSLPTIILTLLQPPVFSPFFFSDRVISQQRRFQM